MGLGKYTVDGSEKVKLKDFPTNSKKDNVDKKEIKKKHAENTLKIAELQERLYADGREGVILVIQALDAAGKDGTIKHVMSGINPQGVDVASFKAPSSEELSHDFLWRVNKCIPQRGKIGIFNRSYYEDVLVVQVHELNKKYKMAKRITGLDSKVFFKKRYKQINNYEEYLYDNSYRVVKIFLNVSAEEQKKRFLERLENPDKNWKFSSSDLSERALWDKYHKVFDDVINETATKECPWYILPADDKWYTRYLVSCILLKTLKDIDPQFPDLPKDEKAKLEEYHTALKNELSPGKAKKEKEEKEITEVTEVTKEALEPESAPEKETVE